MRACVCLWVCWQLCVTFLMKFTRRGRGVIDDIENLVQSFNLKKIFVSSSKLFQKVLDARSSKVAMDDIEKLIELANCRQTYGCCCSFHHCSWSLKGIVLGASIAHVRVQGTGRSCCRCAGSANPLNPETLLYPQFVPAHLSSTVGHLLVFKVKNSADMEYRFQLLALRKALLVDLA